MLAGKRCDNLVQSLGLSSIESNEPGLGQIAPEHQDVSPFRPKESTGIQQGLAGLQRALILRSEIGVKKAHSNSLRVHALARQQATNVTNDTFICIETIEPL